MPPKNIKRAFTGKRKKAGRAAPKAGAGPKAGAAPKAGATEAAATSVKKRPAGRSGDSIAKKRRSIASAIKDITELPQDVRDMLAGLVPSVRSPESRPHPYHQAAAKMVGNALTDVEGNLRNLVAAARAKVEAADSDKAAREAALQEAEEAVPLLKQAVADHKAALVNAKKSVQAAEQSLENRKQEQKVLAASLKVSNTNLQRLQQAYDALREAPPGSAECEKQIKVFRKVGKEFAFHDVLLETLPGILKKQPDRRQTFDNSALHHLEVEFRKRSGAGEADVKARQAQLDQGIKEVEAAEKVVEETKDECQARAGGLEESQTALVTGKSTLVTARKQLQRFDADVQAAEKDLVRLEARYNSFAHGPFRAYQEICEVGTSDDVTMAGSCEPHVPLPESGEPAKTVGGDKLSLAETTLTELLPTLPQQAPMDSEESGLLSASKRRTSLSPC